MSRGRDPGGVDEHVERVSVAALDEALVELVAERVDERDRGGRERSARSDERRRQRPRPERRQQRVLAEVGDDPSPSRADPGRPPPAPRDRRSAPSAPAARSRARPARRSQPRRCRGARCPHGTRWTSNRFVPSSCCGQAGGDPDQVAGLRRPRSRWRAARSRRAARVSPVQSSAIAQLDAEQQVEPAHGLDPRRDREHRHPRAVRGDEARGAAAAGRDDERREPEACRSRRRRPARPSWRRRPRRSRPG